MASRYSYWRVWGIEEGEVRVARNELIPSDSLYDAPVMPHPQHLEAVGAGHITWQPHKQGDVIPFITLPEFITWLDQGGH